MQVDYNIHDIMKFRIEGTNNIPLFGGLDWPFDYFKSFNNKTLENDIFLNIDNFVTDNLKDCKLIDNKYYVKKDYVYAADSSNSISWKAEISGLHDGKVIINVDQMRLPFMETFFFRNSFPQKHFLLHMIVRSMLKKGYFLLHAAAIAKDNGGTIVSGFGSSNKTLLTIDSIKDGYSYLGDDRVLTDGKRLLCFPTFYDEFNFRSTQLVGKEWPTTFNERLKLLGLSTHRYRYRNFSLIDECKLDRVIILRKKTTGRTISHEIDRRDGINAVAMSTMMEEYMTSLQTITLHGPANYFAAYSYIFPNSFTANFWDIFKSELSRRIRKNVRFFTLEFSEYDYKRLKEEIERCR